GAAADVEEDDRGQRQEAELPSQGRRGHFWAAAMRPGSSFSHSSMGRLASTTISSLPLGSRRTRPGVAGPSGITSDSRWMPRPSVTAKIALISFMPTASSTNADLLGGLLDLLPRRVLDRHATSAPLALHPGLGLAGDQDLLGARGQRGGAHPVQQTRDLGVELGQR